MLYRLPRVSAGEAPIRVSINSNLGSWSTGWTNCLLGSHFLFVMKLSDALNPGDLLVWVDCSMIIHPIVLWWSVSVYCLNLRLSREQTWLRLVLAHFNVLGTDALRIAGAYLRGLSLERHAAWVSFDFLVRLKQNLNCRQFLLHTFNSIYVLIFNGKWGFGVLGFWSGKKLTHIC